MAIRRIQQTQPTLLRLKPIFSSSQKFLPVQTDVLTVKTSLQAKPSTGFINRIKASLLDIPHYQKEFVNGRGYVLYISNLVSKMLKSLGNFESSVLKKHQRALGVTLNRPPVVIVSESFYEPHTYLFGLIPIKRIHSNPHPRWTLHHEFGHALDNCLYWPSHIEPFTSTAQKEMAQLSKLELKSLPWYLQQSGSELTSIQVNEELFADLYAAHYQTTDYQAEDRAELLHLASKFPNTMLTVQSEVSKDAINALKKIVF